GERPSRVPHRGPLYGCRCRRLPPLSIVSRFRVLPREGRVYGSRRLEDRASAARPQASTGVHSLCTSSARLLPGCCYGGMLMRRYFLPLVGSICVITGLIILDVGQHISPGTSLTAQERGP